MLAAEGTIDGSSLAWSFRLGITFLPVLGAPHQWPSDNSRLHDLSVYLSTYHIIALPLHSFADSAELF